MTAYFWARACNEASFFWTSARKSKASARFIVGSQLPAPDERDVPTRRAPFPRITPRVLAVVNDFWLPAGPVAGNLEADECQGRPLTPHLAGSSCPRLFGAPRDSAP